MKLGSPVKVKHFACRKVFGILDCPYLLSPRFLSIDTEFLVKRHSSHVNSPLYNLLSDWIRLLISSVTQFLNGQQAVVSLILGGIPSMSSPDIAVH